MNRINELTITFFGTGQDPRTQEDKFLIIFNNNVPLFVPKEEFDKLLGFYANTVLQTPTKPQIKTANNFYLEPQLEDIEPIMDDQEFEDQDNTFLDNDNEYYEESDEDGATAL